MNLPKPVFTAVLVAWLSFAGAYGLVRSGSGTQPLLSWIGLILCVSGPSLFLAGAWLSKSKQTRRTALGYSILCGLGLAVTLAMSYRYGPVAGNAHVWAGITLAGWLVYLRWFTDIPEE